MSDLERYIQEQLEKDSEFKKEYESLESEYTVTKELIKARTDCHMTQKDLAEKSGVRQSNISRIENCTCSPTVATLSALARGMGKKLIVTFVDI